MKNFFILLSVALISACTPASNSVQTSVAETLAARNSQAEEPVITPTVIVELTSTQTQVTDKYGPRGDGTYLVGVEIAAGRWRSQPGYKDELGFKCEVDIYDSNLELIDYVISNPGNVFEIPPNAFQVQFDRCGEVTFFQ